jgi:DNA-directed RNA polymerase subunit N (RpoN/RPB10)
MSLAAPLNGASFAGNLACTAALAPGPSLAPDAPSTLAPGSSFAAASLGPVRCWCGREIQRALTRYERLRAAGASIKDALDSCGFPMGCPFRSEADRCKAPTPPPACCRALIMANVDHYDQHSLYQFAVSHGEGMEAVGGGSRGKPSPMVQQTRP